MISIVIPTLDEERALPRTLAGALAQTGDLEIIVVDGESSDETVTIVEDAAAGDPRIRLLTCERGRARQMEDIAFGLRVRGATRPVMLPETVTTDSRKFDQMGHWRALAHSVSLLIRFRFGKDVSRDEFFTDYR